ncbi:hypothetical protein ACFX1X_019975 [Malus domestica]
MGRAIIREESPEDPGRRTRLWHKDAFNVLRKLTGTRTIKGLVLNFPSTESSPVLNELFLTYGRAVCNMFGKEPGFLQD